MDLPSNAENVAVKDQFGDGLSTSTSTSGDVLLANATLANSLVSGQSIAIAASYNLPSATIQGSKYSLNNFNLFPDVDYYIDQATLTFNLPQGATIVTPQIGSLDSSSTVTRSSFQDTLTVNRAGVSYVDYRMPQSNALQFAYDYNPIWVSFLPTFWVSGLAVVGCVGAVFYRRRKPSEKASATTTAERSSTVKATEATSAQQQTKQAKAADTVTSQRVTPESLKEFTDAYEEKKELTTEIKSLDAKAQKGKIPRRQYKVQRKAIEIRLQNITRNTNRLKQVFRSSSAAYADLMDQLDESEADFNEAEESIKKIEYRQGRGEISLESYKKNIGDLQKRRDKAESTMNGILLRLREKER